MNDALKREIEALSGEGFLFSIFPSETVRENMRSGSVAASIAEVERLWTAYQKSQDAGLAPYSKAGGGSVSAPLLKFMSAETGYPVMTVAAFLNALERAVKEQGWDWKWIDPRAAKQAGQSMTAGESVATGMKAVGQNVANLLKPTLDPVTNLVKYAAIAVVGGAVIYGIYHGTKIFGKKRR